MITREKILQALKSGDIKIKYGNTAVFPDGAQIGGLPHESQKMVDCIFTCLHRADFRTDLSFFDNFYLPSNDPNMQ